MRDRQRAPSPAPLKEPRWSTDIANSNPAMTYLLGGNATNARNLSNDLLNRWVLVQRTSQQPLTRSTSRTRQEHLSQWSDYEDELFIERKIVQKEFNAFVKDDYKMTRDLTLNLGIRWDYFGVPYRGFRFDE